MFIKKINTNLVLYNLITSQEDLNFLTAELSLSKLLAIDTEFRRTTKDNMKLALLQINDGHEIYLLDCVALESTSDILKIFEDKQVVKIFHSCREDIEALHSWTKGGILNIFDTQIANAFLGNELSISYQSLVKDAFGINLKKNETRSNWISRPLSSSQLNYAAMDVEFLMEIYDEQVINLKNSKKILWAREEVDILINNVMSSINLETEEDNFSIPLSKSDQNLFLEDFNKVIEQIAQQNNINKTLLFSKKNQRDFLRDYFSIGIDKAMAIRGKWRTDLILEPSLELFSNIKT